MIRVWWPESPTARQVAGVLGILDFLLEVLEKERGGLCSEPCVTLQPRSLLIDLVPIPTVDPLEAGARITQNLEWLRDALQRLPSLAELAPLSLQMALIVEDLGQCEANLEVLGTPIDLKMVAGAAERLTESRGTQEGSIEGILFSLTLRPDALSFALAVEGGDLHLCRGSVSLATSAAERVGKPCRVHGVLNIRADGRIGIVDPVHRIEPLATIDVD